MKSVRDSTIVLALLICAGAGCRPREQAVVKQNWSGIDQVVAEEIEKGSFPGAVILVGRADTILYWRAFGHKVIEPYRETMTKNTVFDLASLTKPIATATSVMILCDQWKMGLSDYAGTYLPAFACKGKEKVQIGHLLSHTSGLPAYTNANALKEAYGSPCPDELMDKICGLKALGEPGAEFRYSCLGYIVLAKIVEVIGGKSLDEFAEENIFGPLKMSRSTFNPPQSWSKDIAATEIVEGQPLRGTVHDPLARLMGGVAGNAGLFSTAYDLSIYCRMLLDGGTFKGIRVVSSEAVAMMTTAQSHGRGYGFDVHSSYSWVKGSYAPQSAFCHTGYTGTSIVCDPESETYIIILANRSHPHDKGTVKTVRTEVADIVFREFPGLTSVDFGELGRPEETTQCEQESSYH